MSHKIFKSSFRYENYFCFTFSIPTFRPKFMLNSFYVFGPIVLLKHLVRGTNKTKLIKMYIEHCSLKYLMLYLF